MIVLDSSFLIGFYNERDAHNRTARAWMDRLLLGEWGQGLLPEYVLLEVATVLLIRRDHGVSARVSRLLVEAYELDFVSCSDFFPETLELFTSQAGTRLSFADSAIVHVARQRAGGLVLTFDEELGGYPGIRVPSPSTQ